ncbi:FadR/GntR family transcriptional regulator [Noviherbaspirillum soli]|uniref:FadR/GntR family transcriptional regulator n=1 Tax=Noviherbaspirillum soli TaxID=1064518 RepID=UPI00188D76DA|nr:FCD domain-containing protein [Noviherbaspirillum soli]
MYSSDSLQEFRHFLLDELRSGRLHGGDRLPTERELSEIWNIGRSVVRRVLSELKEQGLITQVVGSGTYVSADASEKLQAGAAQVTAMETSPAELMEVRVLLEPVVMQLAIRHATPADFMKMEECCARAEAAQTLEEFEHWDGALHQTIADATHNNFARSMFQLMNSVREQGDWGVLKKRSVTPERRAIYEQEHRDLVAALKARDAEAARELMEAHLVQVRRNMFGY